MRIIMALLAFASIASGCQNTQTRKHANELISTTSALYYQQVVDNLAMTYAQPNGLPFFGLPTQGSETNTRMLSTSYTPGWDFISGGGVYLGRYLFDKQNATLQGQVTNAEAFQLQPTFDPDKLLLLKVAFRMAAGDRTLTVRETSWITRFYIARPDSLGLNRVYYGAITGKDLDAERKRLNLPEIQDKQTKLQALQQDAGTKGDAANNATAFWPFDTKNQLYSLLAQQLDAEHSLELGTTNQGLRSTLQERLRTIRAEISKIATQMGSQDVQAVQAFVQAARKAKDAEEELTQLSDRAGLNELDLNQPDLSVTPACWFVARTSKKQLPKDACYVSNCCNYWVAVPPESMKQLSEFTAAVLDINSISNIPVLAPHTISKATGDVTTPAQPAAPQSLLTPRVTPFPYPAPPQ